MKFRLAAVLVVLLMTLGRARADTQEASKHDSRESSLNVSSQILFCEPSAAERFIAGESIVLGVRIAGLQCDAEGRVDTLLQAEVIDAARKTIVPVANERIHQGLTLGGGEVAWGRSITFPADSLGKHTIRVTIIDQIDGRQVTDEVNVVVEQPSAFGLINVRTSLDKSGTVPSDVIPLGRPIFVLMAANGYALEDGKPNVQIAASITDRAGKQLTPDKVKVHLDAEESIYGSSNQANVGLYFSSLNRSGHFLIQLHAKDELSGKEASRTIPIVVASVGADSTTQTATRPQPNRR